MGQARRFSDGRAVLSENAQSVEFFKDCRSKNRPEKENLLMQYKKAGLTSQ